jgi:hypothetical protein
MMHCAMHVWPAQQAIGRQEWPRPPGLLRSFPEQHDPNSLGKD